MELFPKTSAVPIKPRTMWQAALAMPCSFEDVLDYVSDYCGKYEQRVIIKVLQNELGIRIRCAGRDM